MIHRSRRRQLIVTILACAWCAGGCGSGGSGSTDEALPAQEYVVDGILAQLPDGPGHELMIRHVPIPDFVNASGDTVGMNAMTMGFPVADPAILQGFAPGDSVRFAFEVRWGANMPLRLSAIEHLAPGTTLDFGPRDDR